VDDTDGTLDRDRAVAALRELVEALDRRLPHVERMGEVRIAREAAALRQEAARRIQELAGAASPSATSEGDRADADMTDDGGPLRRK
jgi:hypothetical protein